MQTIRLGNCEISIKEVPKRPMSEKQRDAWNYFLYNHDGALEFPVSTMQERGATFRFIEENYRWLLENRKKKAALALKSIISRSHVSTLRNFGPDLVRDLVRRFELELEDALLERVIKL